MAIGGHCLRNTNFFVPSRVAWDSSNFLYLFSEGTLLILLGFFREWPIQLRISAIVFIFTVINRNVSLILGVQLYRDHILNRMNRLLTRCSFLHMINLVFLMIISRLSTRACLLFTYFIGWLEGHSFGLPDDHIFNGGARCHIQALCFMPRDRWNISSDCLIDFSRLFSGSPRSLLFNVSVYQGDRVNFLM